MTRGMIVTVLAAYDGVNTKVPVGHWYEAGRQWAMEKGISDGTDMNGTLTREQLAVMLWNYAGNPEPSRDVCDFADGSSASPWAVQALGWAAEQGLISGTGDGSLLPQEKATRAQAAVILSQFLHQLNESK